MYEGGECVWWIWAGLRIFIGFGVMTIVLKRLTRSIQSRTRALVWQSSLSLAVWCAAYVATANTLVPDERMAVVGTLGFFSSFASYCHWRAFQLSVSKTALMGQGDDIIAFTIAFFLLGETEILRPLLVVGAGLSICAGLAFVYLRRDADKTTVWTISKWIALSAVVWGITLPCTRYFAGGGMGLPEYCFSWYAGVFAGSLVMRVSIGRREQDDLCLGKQFRLVALASLLSAISISAHFLSKRYAPIVVVQPIYQVAELTIPPLIGLWYFGEGKNLRAREIAVLCITVLGIVLIGLSHR